MLNKPLVFGSIFKFEGQVSVFNYNDGPTYRCLFPEPPASNDAPDCATIGVVASLPGIVGTLQANETIKIVVQHGDVLSGRLLVVDVASMQIQVLQFSANAINKKIDKLSEPGVACSLQTEIDYERVKKMLEDSFVQLIDVREEEEHQVRNIGGINIPLSILKYKYQHLDPTATTIIYCASGKRSKVAMELLSGNGFREVYSLQNGLLAVHSR
jgi:adenylyltransferase/sulfurtransferase